MNERITRRRVVRLAGAAGAAALLIPGNSWAQGTPSQALRVRPNVTTLKVDSPILTSYAKAIQAMANLPAGDPRNWTKQARIHFDHCPHGNWFFLPWHRAYIYYFEQICRNLSGDPEFVLPYWNWTEDPQVPKAFWNGVLNDPTRGIKRTDSLLPEFIGQPVIDEIMRNTDFEQFASYKSTATRGGQGGGQAELESRPHNYVHGRIKGDMATYMSPLDPIFWLHHANIDRIWAMWNRLYTNTNDPVWHDYKDPAYFVDAKNSAKAFVVADVLSTYQLGYRYDTQPEQVAAVPPAPIFKTLSELTLQTESTVIARVNAPAALVLPYKAGFFREAQSVALAGLKERRNTRVLLTISNVEAPSNPETFARVFLNCDYLSQDTPINDPHYVGSIAFFVDPKAELDHGGLNYVLDATNTMAALQRAKEFPTEKIEPQMLTVAPAGATGKAAEVAANKFEMSIAQVQ